MSLKLYRPVEGGLEPRPVQPRDWRTRLRSRPLGPVAPRQPRSPTTAGPFQGVLLFGGLAGLTLVLLLLGYLTGFWH